MSNSVKRWSFERREDTKEDEQFDRLQGEGTKEEREENFEKLGSYVRETYQW